MHDIPDCHYTRPAANGGDSFTVAMPRLTFGRGCLREAGERAAHLGMKRVALFADPYQLESYALLTVTESLQAAGIQFAVFSDIRIEPDDASVRRGVEFLRGGTFDGVISVGGGSVIDTAKAAMASARCGHDVHDFFAPPIGKGAPINQPMWPHMACPTTSGTGSECTSVTVIRLTELNTKFVFASPYLLPDVALVDPACCDTLSAKAVGSTGFDLLCHALESYTAKAYISHTKIASPNARQYLQGANPFSDMIVQEAMKRAGTMLERGVRDTGDHEARDSLSFAATLAGIGFGNTGTHVPHAMSYGITHLMRNVSTDGYPVETPFVPHGISVITNAPSIFAYTAIGAPARHLRAAKWLGAEVGDAGPAEAGEVLSKRLIELMRITGMPNGLKGLGFDESDVIPMTQSSMRQARALLNCSREVNAVDMENMYRGALSYW